MNWLADSDLSSLFWLHLKRYTFYLRRIPKVLFLLFVLPGRRANMKLFDVGNWVPKIMIALDLPLLKPCLFQSVVTRYPSRALLSCVSVPEALSFPIVNMKSCDTFSVLDSSLPTQFMAFWRECESVEDVSASCFSGSDLHHYLLVAKPLIQKWIKHIWSVHELDFLFQSQHRHTTCCFVSSTCLSFGRRKSGKRIGRKQR